MAEPTSNAVSGAEGWALTGAEEIGSSRAHLLGERGLGRPPGQARRPTGPAWWHWVAHEGEQPHRSPQAGEPGGRPIVGSRPCGDRLQTSGRSGHCRPSCMYPTRARTASAHGSGTCRSTVTEPRWSSRLEQRLMRVDLAGLVGADSRRCRDSTSTVIRGHQSGGRVTGHARRGRRARPVLPLGAAASSPKPGAPVPGVAHRRRYPGLPPRPAGSRAGYRGVAADRAMVGIADPGPVLARRCGRSARYWCTAAIYGTSATSSGRFLRTYRSSRPCAARSMTRDAARYRPRGVRHRGGGAARPFIGLASVASDTCARNGYHPCPERCYAQTRHWATHSRQRSATGAGPRAGRPYSAVLDAYRELTRRTPSA